MLVKRAVHTSVFLSMFEGRSVFKAVSRSVVQTRPSIQGAKGKKHRLTSAKHESEECYESVQDWNSIKYLAGDWTNNLSVTIHQELTFKLVVSTGSVVFVRVRRCAMHSGSAAFNPRETLPAHHLHKVEVEATSCSQGCPECFVAAGSSRKNNKNETLLS